MFETPTQTVDSLEIFEAVKPRKTLKGLSFYYISGRKLLTELRSPKTKELRVRAAKAFKDVNYHIPCSDIFLFLKHRFSNEPIQSSKHEFCLQLFFSPSKGFMVEIADRKKGETASRKLKLSSLLLAPLAASGVTAESAIQEVEQAMLSHEAA
ncbi:MAG: hypothetical protein R3A13_11940 [Bdellovibrionota bacterium]